MSRREAIRAARAAAQRRRRTVLLALLSVATAAALVATDLPSRPLPGPVVTAGRAVAAAVGPAAPAAATPFAPGPAAAASPVAGTPAPAAAAYTQAATSQDPDRADAEPAPSGTSGSTPTVGTGAFSFIPGPGPVAGLTGQMLRFHVAVEEGAGQDDAAFAAAVDAILADPRGWAREGLRFQRVSE
ncbi:MAG TPA: DUF3152 domain-containing protein, partial [Micromonosporaceae bacterium]|nr:DUF3152 domain-containing protein [Micromonosporaceae bacterium]